MIHLFRFVTFCCLFLWLPAHAKEQWQQKKSRQGIHVFQLHKNSKYNQLHTKGIMKTQAAPEAVIALMKDLKVCQEWFFGCLSAEYLPSQGGSGRWVHMMFKGPLWLKDRDVVVYIETQQLDKNKWLINIKNHPELHPNKKFVRIQQIEASWLLTPLDNGELEVTYVVYMDPRINFKMGVNKYNRDAVFYTMLNMQRMLQKAPYNQVRKLAVD